MLVQESEFLVKTRCTSEKTAACSDQRANAIMSVQAWHGHILTLEFTSALNWTCHLSPPQAEPQCGQHNAWAVLSLFTVKWMLTSVSAQ